ncbi:hypothetical protein IPL68_07675 [Candidatus Saccharibacteria bacterium]|nr:MAG: hypothetical protein IPL68_07675 [Candidatus Saccharibacteria bacterium]
MQVDELRKRLQKHGVSVQLTTAAKQYLIEHGYDAKNGVRPLRRLIQDTIEDQLAIDILDDKFTKGDIIHVGSRDDALTYATHSE